MADAILPPMADDCGIAVFRHGERGDLDPAYPDACLCGRFLNYMDCPELFSEWDGLVICAGEGQERSGSE